MVGGQQTDGTWLHTGRLIIQCQMPNGAVIKLTLPDDFIALGTPPNSLEDLTYGG
jgi:hypothetical protein